MTRFSAHNIFIGIVIAALVIIWGIALAQYGQSRQHTESVTPTEETCGTPPAKGDNKQPEEVIPPGQNNDSDAEPAPPNEPANPPASQPAPETKPEVVPTPTPTPAEVCFASRNGMQLFFTFDAGSGNQSFTGILSALSKYGKGTFFVTGVWAENNPAELRQISSGGHEIYNHTYNHPNLTEISKDAIIQQFSSTENIVQSITNKSTKPYFRPPYGARNQQVLDTAWSQGYRSVYWSVDTLDWQETATTASVKQRVMDNLKPGNIYLMHIGSNVTGQIIDEIFREVKAKGYSINSLSHGL